MNLRVASSTKLEMPTFRTLREGRKSHQDRLVTFVEYWEDKPHKGIWVSKRGRLQFIDDVDQPDVKNSDSTVMRKGSPEAEEQLAIAPNP